MASTGEVACFGKNVVQAFYTAHASNHTNFKSLPLPSSSRVLLSSDEFYFKDLKSLAQMFHSMGYTILVDSLDKVNQIDIPCTLFDISVLNDSKKAKDAFASVSLVISLFNSKNDEIGYLIRRNAVDFGVGLLNEANTSLLFAHSLKQVLNRDWDISDVVKSLDEFQAIGSSVKARATL